ncbi:MAG: hypothetical protein AUJ56_06685 [Zetaproteobacteria bacterium CG1_02_49_23]|nr:MAG: hypothetical protein AUJ56_06685 [Zetaproteobacteria bacterium CG1_02_49_23]
MHKIFTVLAVLSIFGLSGVATAGSQNPCNPCSIKSEKINPCDMKSQNPCSMQMDQQKKANPCDMKSQNPCSMNMDNMKKANPCDMKSHNPCAMKKNDMQKMNPCNPCAGASMDDDAKKPIREAAFSNYQEAADLGSTMWNNENLGSSGLSCLSCHAGYENMNFDKNQNFPHFVAMVGDVVTLDQMINYCMMNPMKGEQFEQNSKDLTAMAAYYRAYRMQYLQDKRP